jgi:hypothetical protein
MTVALQNLTELQLDGLTLSQLTERMDNFLLDIHNKKTPPGLHVFPPRLPSQLLSCSLVNRYPDQAQRRIAYQAFSLLLQLELNMSACGISNKLLFGVNHNPENWRNPMFRLQEGVLHQYHLIGSRISFEIFMDLLHLIETGELLKPYKKSKIKAFRKWLLGSQTPFRYYGHILVRAYEFDRSHRSPVVHGASPLPRQLLRLGDHDGALANEALQLVNVMSNVWTPLLELSSGRRPNQMQLGDGMREWFDAYMHGTEDDVTRVLNELLQVIQEN